MSPRVGQVYVAEHGDVAANHTNDHRPVIHTPEFCLCIVKLAQLLKHDSVEENKESTVRSEAISTKSSRAFALGPAHKVYLYKMYIACITEGGGMSLTENPEECQILNTRKQHFLGKQVMRPAFLIQLLPVVCLFPLL